MKPAPSVSYCEKTSSSWRSSRERGSATWTLQEKAKSTRGYTVGVRWVYGGCTVGIRTVGIPLLCRGHAVAMPWPCRGHAVAMPWPCRGRAVTMRWPCHGHAVAIPWPSRPLPAREGEEHRVVRLGSNHPNRRVRLLEEVTHLENRGGDTRLPSGYTRLPSGYKRVESGAVGGKWGGCSG